MRGDDFVIAGPMTSIKWFQVKVQSKYEVKTDVVGPAPEGCSEELKILGRIVRWKADRIEYESDSGMQNCWSSHWGSKSHAAWELLESQRGK